MQERSVDTRTKEELIAQLKETAASYTPEWQFDLENPDIGAALAFVYAELFAGTLRRINKILKKMR